MVQCCALRRNDTALIAETSSKSIEQPCRGITTYQYRQNLSWVISLQGFPIRWASDDRELALFKISGLVTDAAMPRAENERMGLTTKQRGGTTVSLQYSTTKRERPSHIQGHLENGDQPCLYCRGRCVPK